MDRESYSVDDIISEVKRRRAEAEKQNSHTESKSDETKENEPENIEKAVVQKNSLPESEENVNEIVEDKPIDEPSQVAETSYKKQEEDEFSYKGLIDKGLEDDLSIVLNDIENSNDESDEEILEEKVEDAIEKAVEESEPDEENMVADFDEPSVVADDEEKESDNAENIDDTEKNEVFTQVPQEEELKEDCEEENIIEDDNDAAINLMNYAEVENSSEEDTEETVEEQENEPEQAEFENVLSFEASDAYSMAHPSEEEKNAKESKRKKENKDKAEKKKRKKKFIRNILIIILVMTLVAVIGGGIYIQRAIDRVSDENQTQHEDVWKGMGELKENFPQINETEATELTSLQDMIKTWYYNGEPCSSSHVLNVLLIGEDTRGSDILENETRADSAIIASINIDTKEITLTSILRDAYAYWENTEGDESSGIFEKINGAMSIGDVHTYIKTVEKLYKINIDNYVIVNFDSFEKIVDEIGGVTLELTSAEIREINGHQKRYGNVNIDQNFDGNSGEMQLNGKQALAYCRIRKLDSDNMRADRQKICLTKILEKVKNGSKVTLLKVVNSMIPYVKTGFSSNEIVSIAKYALSQGWLTYDVKMTSVPYNRINERGMGGTYYGAWVWRPDYPADAYYMQTLLYGKSSITLAQERVDVIGCRDYGFYSETLTPCYATIHNNSYGEVTTYEFQNKESESTSN